MIATKAGEIRAFGSRILKREDVVSGEVYSCGIHLPQDMKVWSVGLGRAVVGLDGRVSRVFSRSDEDRAIAVAKEPVRVGEVVAILGDQIVVQLDGRWVSVSEHEVVAAAVGETEKQLHLIIPLYDVEKADPMKPAGYMEAVRAARRELASIYGPASKEQMSRILLLLDKPWADIPTGTRDELLAQIGAIFPQHSLGILHPEEIAGLSSTGREMMKSVRAHIAERLPVNVSLSLRDERALSWLSGTTTGYVRDQYGRISKQMADQARGIIRSGLEAGYSNQDIGSRLSSAISGSYEAKMSNYWTVVANSFIGRSRSMSQVVCYNEAAIEKVMAYAVMDEVTTEFCRLIHEQIIDVKTVSEMMTGLERLSDPEQIKDANPWVVRQGNDWGVWRGGEWSKIMTVDKPGAGTWGRGEYTRAYSDAKYLTDRGVGFPPYHALCRTTTITLTESLTAPVSIPSGEVVRPVSTPVPPQQPVVPAHDERFYRRLATSERGRIMHQEAMAAGGRIEDLLRSRYGTGRVVNGLSELRWGEIEEDALKFVKQMGKGNSIFGQLVKSNGIAGDVMGLYASEIERSMALYDYLARIDQVGLYSPANAAAVKSLGSATKNLMFRDLKIMFTDFATSFYRDGVINLSKQRLTTSADFRNHLMHEFAHFIENYKGGSLTATPSRYEVVRRCFTEGSGGVVDSLGNLTGQENLRGFAGFVPKEGVVPFRNQYASKIYYMRTYNIGDTIKAGDYLDFASDTEVASTVLEDLANLHAFDAEQYRVALGMLSEFVKRGF